MQESRTSKNPDIIFLDCSYYRIKQCHCNYFVWLDKLISKYSGHEDDNDVEGRILMLENRLEQLEYKI
ncbi:hypothetical protein Ahy_A10g047843 [Arachis hypogaea]|uniref:Uncharacterized protein n=1 Tax=Arachis hypogaea TaxID=3818 RepID=A0A445B3L9_ARAHY|nr:hypothetical protein Ahy_A10g047843 [Arachis hypogaea]